MDEFDVLQSKGLHMMRLKEPKKELSPEEMYYA
jgi:hypothetical protein